MYTKIVYQEQAIYFTNEPYQTLHVKYNPAYESYTFDVQMFDEDSPNLIYRCETPHWDSGINKKMQFSNICNWIEEDYLIE